MLGAKNTPIDKSWVKSKHLESCLMASVWRVGACTDYQCTLLSDISKSYFIAFTVKYGKQPTFS